jgi:hypothetical protein
MTAEEVFCDLNDKYGEEFNWNMVPFTNKTFVAELKREIGENHFLYNERIWQWLNVTQMMMYYMCVGMKVTQIFIIFFI